MPDLPAAVRRHLALSGQPAESPFHAAQVSLNFGEAVHPAALRTAWDAVRDAHAALRWKFESAESLGESAETGWQELDWLSSPPADLAAEWQQLVDSDAARPVASGAEPPCRITLIRLPNGSSHLLWTFHSALLDEDSISTALHRWLHAYDCARMGGELPAFSDSYAPLAGPDAKEWKPSFEGFTSARPLIVLPLPETSQPAGVRRSISHVYERPERASLAAAAAGLGIELRSLLKAVWVFVLSRAAGASDVLLLELASGGDGLGRRESPLLQRHVLEGHSTAGDLLRAFAHPAPAPSYDPAQIARELNLPPSALTPAAAFLYRDSSLNDRLQLEMPRWMAADVQLLQKTAGPLVLRAVASDRPEIALDYDPTHISASAAHLLFDIFRRTLEMFAADPALPLDAFALPADPAEVRGPDVPATFRSLVPQGIHELFADTASEFPDAIAVEVGEEKLTFAQLNSAANQLARHLRKRGINAGARVGLAIESSPRWIIAMLGALKAGAVIVPAELGAGKHPAVSAWIVDTLREGETPAEPVIQMETEAAAIEGEKGRGLQSESRAESEALAFLVDNTPATRTHEALAASLRSWSALVGLQPTDRVLQFAPSHTFAAIEEALATLLTGATLVLRTDRNWATRTAFQEFVAQSQVQVLSVPVPFWSQWTHYLAELSKSAPPTLRVAVISGATPAPNAVDAWRAAAPESRLLFRTTTTASFGGGVAAELSDSASLALGLPAPGCTVRIVDANGCALPAGLPGFVEVRAEAGEFLPLKTEAFAEPETGRLLARLELEAHLLGSRLAPNEKIIRLAAATHPEIFDAYVEKRLIAAREEWCLWIAPRDSERGEPHDFREWLAGRLAAVPRRVRALPRLPLDPHGEIDVRALDDPSPEDPGVSSLPGSEAEEKLRQAVSRVLGGRRLDLDEIISDGRTKPQLAKLLHEAVARVEPRVELADFTDGFSIRSLARSVRGRRTNLNSTWKPLEPLRGSGKLPPLVFVHDLDGTSRPYAPLVANLGDDQPCYAFTARGLAEPDASHQTVEEIAAAYVEALRVFDAAGPFRLIGYGFGGIVAFEMARQLQSANTEVALLVALASEPPASRSPAAFLAGGWKRAVRDLLGANKKDDATSRKRNQDTPVFRANQEAARKYTPPRSALSAHIFVPEREFADFKSVRSGWLACCDDARFYQVPCSPAEMRDEPAVEAIANAIAKLAAAKDLSDELEE